jgi:hypothetical protein
MWLVFGSFASVISSTNPRPACLKGRPLAPAAWRSSVASSQVVLSPMTELLAATGSFNARKVVMDLIAFLIFLIGFYL